VEVEQPPDPPRVTLNQVGDVILDNTEQLRALAEPSALAAFSWLQRHGPATTVRVAAELGVSTFDLEARLETLRANGLADREQDLWRCPGQGLLLQPPADDPEAAAAARALGNVMLLSGEHLPREWAATVEPELELPWVRAAGVLNAGVVVTTEELTAVQVELERVLEPYLTRPSTRVPTDARNVRVLAYFLPDPAR
jgi:hypothetical protein